MFEQLSSGERATAIQRLTALWALNECGLGGMLHALQSPFTGLLVGSIAMICIAMICAFARQKWRAVMASLVVVLIIKALVSPHSSPTAYLAVIFQGVTGAFIYRFIPGLFLSSLLFACLGLLESAMQRLLVLTIIYGNSLWEAIDLWGVFVSERWGVIIPVSSSALLIYTYLMIHFLAGIILGWFIYRIIRSIHRLWGSSKFQLQLNHEDRKSFFKEPGKKKKWKRYLLFLVVIIMITAAYTMTDTGKAIMVIVRAAGILVLWFVFLAPFILKLLKRFLAGKHQQVSEQVQHTMDIFPHLIWILDKAWKETKDHSWMTRWKLFVIHSLLYILQYQTSYDTYSDRADKTS